MNNELRVLVEILIRKGIITEKELKDVEEELRLKIYKQHEEDLDYHTY